jgi:hypothetical protein
MKRQMLDSWQPIASPSRPIKGQSKLIFVDLEPNVKHQPYLSFDVAIDVPGIVGNQPLIWTLIFILSEVTRVIDEFRPLFVDFDPAKLES